MPLWHLTNNGNVVQCKNHCEIKHEHYLGTYENALKWFHVNENEVKSWGKLVNIIVFQQTGVRCAPKLSSELFDILVRAQSEHKYWAVEKEREQRALDALEQARIMGLIYDDQLVAVLQKSGRPAAKNRLYRHEKLLQSG